MSEVDLELLITLDDPRYGPEEDTFHQETSGATTTQRNGRQEHIEIG